MATLESEETAGGGVVFDVLTPFVDVVRVPVVRGHVSGDVQNGEVAAAAGIEEGVGDEGFVVGVYAGGVVGSGGVVVVVLDEGCVEVACEGEGEGEEEGGEGHGVFWGG